MTSASELLYNRRYRFGRSSDQFEVGANFGSQPQIDRINRRQRDHNNPGGNHARRDRIDTEVCDSLQRTHHHLRQPPLHRPFHTPHELESILLEDSGLQFSPGNANHSGSQVNVRERLRARANDRLPGAVLLARERLLQRLRGVTLSSTRWSNRNSLGTSSHHNPNPIYGRDFRLVESADWETEPSRERLSTFIPSTKRPPGLSRNELSRLPIEVFSLREKISEQCPSWAIGECSICLESFFEGDELVRLPCDHMYHFRCLEPWVRSCGDCPYCRRGIDVNSHRPGEDS